jgi:hypothetical protein
MPRRPRFSLKDPNDSTAIRLPKSLHARLLKAGVSLGLGTFDPQKRFQGATVHTILSELLDRQFGKGGPA